MSSSKAETFRLGQDEIKRKWPDKRLLAFNLASMARTYHDEARTRLPMEDYIHMYVLLGHDIALADEPRQCEAAFEYAINRLSPND